VPLQDEEDLAGHLSLDEGRGPGSELNAPRGRQEVAPIFFGQAGQEPGATD
jgi:hypothetical protein